MDTLAVQLPGGAWRDGAHVAGARVRALTGCDEEWLLDNAGEPASALATGLLERCVVELGAAAPTADDLEALTVGDREALLWHLRRGTFGERIDAVVECGACTQKLDVALGVGDLLEAPYGDRAPTCTEMLGDAEVVFRLPTGADQASVLGADPDTGAQRILERCVLQVDGAEPDPRALAELAGTLAEAMAARDPQAETRLEAICPACQETVEALLDALAFLREEVAGSARFLYDEVHTIAWHYHWSEAEIVGLPTARRRIYLDLIARAYEGASP